MLRTKQGCLLELAKEGRFLAIAHGCNCHNIMGAGLAKQVRLAFPSAYEADQRTPKGDPVKMGWYSKSDGNPLMVYNLYTQFGLGPNAEAWAIRASLKRVIDDHTFRNGEGDLGIPLIGCGIGGLKEQDLMQILTELDTRRVVLVRQ